MLQVAASQLVATAICFVEYGEHKEPCISQGSGSFKGRNKVCGPWRLSPSTKRASSPSGMSGGLQYIGTEIGNASNCITAEIHFDFTECIPLDQIVAQKALDHGPLVMEHLKMMDTIV